MKVSQKFNCHLLTKPHYHSQRLQNCCIMTSQQKYGEGNGTPLQHSCLENPTDVVFVYFFPLFTEEGFLISPCYSLELFRCVYLSAFKWIYLSFSPLPFTSLLFSTTCKSSSDNHFAFLHFFFLGMVLITTSCTMLRTSIHSSSGTLSYLIP